MLMKAVMPKKFQLKRISNSGVSDILFPDGGEIHLYRRVRHFACTVRSR